MTVVFDVCVQKMLIISTFYLGLSDATEPVRLGSACVAVALLNKSVITTQKRTKA